MTLAIAFVLGLLFLALLFFVKQWLAPDVVALGLLVLLVLGRVLEPREAFRSFGNEALVTVAAMFVLSAGLIRTGAVSFVGRRLLALSGTSELMLLLSLMTTVALCSALINNTPVAVIFLPIVLGLSESSGIRASKLLIPMSYATVVGGMSTVIGTSTNVLVSSMLPDHGLQPIALFEPLPLTLAGFAMTLLYMALVGRHLLPERTPLTAGLRSGKIHDYVTEVVIPPGSPLVRQSLRQAILERAPGIQVLQLIRGEDILQPDPRRLLAERDALIVKGEVNALLTLHRSPGADLAPTLATPAMDARSKDVTLAELLVRPASGAIGERVRDLNLRSRHGIAVLAVQRHAVHIREKVGDLRLRFGDVLLVQADAEALDELKGSPDFIVVEGVHEQVVLSHRSWFALTVTAGVVLLAALQIPGLPISVLAVAGALLMVMGGCLGVRDAYRAIDLPILMLIGGTLALGQALDNSGAARWLASGIVDTLGTLGPVALLSGIYFLTNALTAVISNNAAAVLLLPIAVSTAAQSGLDPRPFVLAIMFGASIDFSTPFGYQTNTFVYGPGGYRFLDYVRVGGPLNLLWWALATVLIPLIWPLERAG